MKLANTKKIREIREKWSSGKYPFSFRGLTAVQRHYPKVKKDVIREALAGLDTYTLFREEKKPKRYNPIFVRKKREILQSDLIDLTGLSKENDNVKFLLVVLDTFTRYVWIEPLKDKSAPTVLEAFKRIEKKMPQGLGQAIMTDQGKEYVNGQFQRYLAGKNVRVIVPNNKCPHVERFNRTFQNILYKYMEENQTHTYVDRLQSFVDLYNNSYHRILKMSPFQAEQEANYTDVLSAVENYYAKAAPDVRPPNQFQVGDHVRITGHKSMFHKGYYQTFLPKIYKVTKVVSHLPITMYKIADLETNVEEAGTWYANELQLVSKDYDGTVFKIEEVIKTKGKGNKKQALVKWKYWPESTNSWIPYADIQALGN